MSAKLPMPISHCHWLCSQIPTTLVPAGRLVTLHVYIETHECLQFQILIPSTHSPFFFLLPHRSTRFSRVCQEYVRDCSTNCTRRGSGD